MIYNKFNFDDGSNHVNEPFYGGPECLVPTLIEPRLFRDERGYFFESFNMREFTEKMGKTTAVNIDMELPNANTSLIYVGIHVDAYIYQ